MKTSENLLILTLFLSSSLFIADTSSLLAQEKTKPITGVIAGNTTKDSAVDYAGESDSGPNPISGSVSKERPGRFIVRIFNSSEDERYSASFTLDLLDRNGKKVRSESFSYTLSPNDKKERIVSAPQSAEQTMLKLTSVKSLTKG